jgi:hypothetical protein
LCGCGKSQEDLPPLLPIKGKVVKNNQPVQGGSVMLKPEDLQGDFMVIGNVDRDGRFELVTIRRDTRANGVPEGRYFVTYSPSDTTKPVSPTTLPEPVRIDAATKELVLDLATADQ